MLLSSLLNSIEYIAKSFKEQEITSVTSNSKEATEESIFVCIKGFSTDGHNFAMSAYANGCRVFVCKYEPQGLPSDTTVILVENTRKALALLSCVVNYHPSHSLFTIGITGTKGKTTTALMIKQLLDNAGFYTGYIGSNGVIYGNEHIQTANTTPESYLLQKYMRDMVDSGIKCVVLEVSSQALSLYRVLGIKFDVCIFTNLSPDHIGPNEHNSFEEYFLAKKQLFDEYSPSLVIANADDEYTEAILKDCKAQKLYYSCKQKADFTARDLSLSKTESHLGISFNCQYKDEIIPCTLPVAGEFNVSNALSAIAVAKHLEIASPRISLGLLDVVIEGRFETLSSKNGACFVIDYAHNGLSLEAALISLKKYEPTKLICLFGSVGGRTQVRRGQLGEVANKYADFSIITSDNPDFESPETIMNDIAQMYEDPNSYVKIADREEAIKYAYTIAQKGDIILLAGKGHEKYQLIRGKKEHFNEREILEDLIRSEEILCEK